MSWGISGDIGLQFQQQLQQQLEQQLVQQQFAEQVRQFNERQRLEQAAMNQRAIESDELAKYRNRSLDSQDAARRDRNNAQGLEDMYRQREIMDAENAPEPLVTKTVNRGGKPVIMGLTRKQLEGGEFEEYREPRAPRAPERPQYIQVTGPDGKLRLMTPDEIRAQGGVDTAKAQANALPPEQANQTRSDILSAAKALRQHQGLGAFTGTKFNLSHGLGWYDEPIAGTDAAGAKALYDNFVSLSALPNLEKLRGPLSDKDIEFIKSASTRLKPGVNDSNFVQELDAIIQKLEAAGAGGGGAGTVKMKAPDGSVRDVPADKVDFFKSRGAVVVP